MREEIKDPRWLQVGDEPSDTLSEEGRRVLLEMHEQAVAVYEGLNDIAIHGKQSSFGFDEIGEQAEKLSYEANRIVVAIQEAADYWEVCL